MAQQTIDNGTFTGDPSAEEIRISFDKTNSNFTELYAGLALGGSILTIDQPISMVGATQGESESKQVADAITARTNDFTIPLGSIPIVSSYLPYITGDNTTAYVQKNTFILNTGEGTYGATGSITLDASNVIKINKEKEIIKPDTVIDMGDIGATALSTAVNNASPSNTKLGLTLVTAIQSGVIQNYIFDAANGDYGSGDLQTSSDNFIDLNAEPDLSRNISDNAKEPIVRSIDITIGVEDLGRTNVFSQNNSAIVVDTDVNLFIENGSTFLVQFTGNGTHTMVIPSTTESLTSYKKYDIVLVQKVSANNWFATRLGETTTTNELIGDSLQLTTGVVNPAYSEGKVFYDDTKKAVSYYNDESDTTVNLGQELIVKVYNNNGATLTNGTAVKVDGGIVGGVPTVVKAQANTIENANALGVCSHDITVGSTGYVTIWGEVGDVDTSSFTAGDTLYVDETTAGNLTNVEQAILKPIALVLVSDVSVGRIIVSQKPVINVTAIGQIGGLAGATQAISTTPEVLEIYTNTPFEQNVDIVQTGASPYTAEALPTSVGATGFYRVGFNISITSATNAVFTFEVYVNSVATGILAKIDLSNNNVDFGSTAFGAITQSTISDADDMEIYVYSDSGTPTFTCDSAIFNVERIGNV